MARQILYSIVNANGFLFFQFKDAIYEVCSKSIANFVFFQNFLFIHEYLFCPLQSNPRQILYTLAKLFFPILKALKKIILCLCYSYERIAVRLVKRKAPASSNASSSSIAEKAIYLIHNVCIEDA